MAAHVLRRADEHTAVQSYEVPLLVGAAGCLTCSSLQASSSGSACASCGPGHRRARVAEPTTRTLATVCTVLGLATPGPRCCNVWRTLSEPLAWCRRFLAETEPVTLGDLRVVALRMQGLGPTRIATRVGRRSVPPRHHIDRTCLAVALRFADRHTASGAQAPRHLGTASQQLVHGGLPAYSDDPISQDAFNRLWLKGLALDDIRAALSIGPKVAKAHATAAPPRWVGKDIQAFLGWSRENHRLRLARCHFPEPDGRDGVKDWWWPGGYRAGSKPTLRPLSSLQRFRGPA